MSTRGRINIKEWGNSLVEIGEMSRAAFEELVRANEAKAEFMKKHNLPTNIMYGQIQRLEELTGILPPNYENELFWLRCVPREQHVRTETFIDIGVEEIKKKIPEFSRRNKYIYQIIEYWKTKYSGTIIANNGKIVQELWLGSHVRQETLTIDDVFSQSIDLTKGEIHFSYSPNSEREQKEIMINALRFFVDKLSRQKLEQLRFYADYGYREDKGYRFLDGSELRFWTNTNL